MHERYRGAGSTRLNLLLAVLLLAGLAGTVLADTPQRPNIIIILADDLGFTDLGAFGSEIATPNLDQLAKSGIRLTNFHMMPSCQPSRAVLLTGADNHVAGMGSQESLLTNSQKGQPGYELRITDRVESVVAQLQSSGYQTFMSGKWHLGESREDWPDRKGFEHWFSLLQGGGSHLDASGITPRSPVATYIENGETASIPEDFYSSDYFTTKLLGFLQTQREPERPFFAFLSFTAPHWPLHARPQDMEKYRGSYDAGYDALRQNRIAGASRAGVVPADSKSGVVPGLRSWQELSADEQAIEARKMEIYAAMVERLDFNIGRLTEFLEASGQAENTILIFASDNGAEGHAMEEYPSLKNWIAENYDNRLDNIGRTGSYTATGPGWAQASMGPFHLYKGYMSEGGTRVPAIIHLPGRQGAGTTRTSYASVADIAPTLLEWAGIEKEADHTIRGRSMADWLDGEQQTLYQPNESIAWELFGRRAVYRGDWKLLWMEQPWGTGEWQLFDIRKDPGETRNLAAQHPDILEALVADWQNFAQRSGVILPDQPLPY
jgi:arylsulfatase